MPTKSDIQSPTVPHPFDYDLLVVIGTTYSSPNDANTETDLEMCVIQYYTERTRYQTSMNQRTGTVGEDLPHESRVLFWIVFLGSVRCPNCCLPTLISTGVALRRWHCAIQWNKTVLDVLNRSVRTAIETTHTCIERDRRRAQQGHRVFAVTQPGVVTPACTVRLRVGSPESMAARSIGRYERRRSRLRRHYRQRWLSVVRSRRRFPSRGRRLMA